MTPRRGFALLASVWLMVAIAAVAMEASWLARVRRLATANVLEEAQARAAADAGLEHARARLARALSDRGDVGAVGLVDPWRFAAGASDTVAMGSARYVFSVRDDGATFDVNRAGEDEVRRLLVACGADDALAARTAQRIADWRDPDTHRRSQGAERTEYLAAGARDLPRDADVQRVSELDGVLEMPAVPWSCARAALSVGGVGQVNVNTAPRDVLRALPGMSEAGVEVLLASRRDGARIGNFVEFTERIPPALREGVMRASDRLLPRLSYDTYAVRVHSEGWVQGSPVRVSAEALMVRGGGTVFVQWREFR